MKLVPFNGKIGGFYKKTDNYDTIKEFKASGLECAEIEGFPQKDAYSCAASLRNTIKRYNMFGVRSVVRNGRVFLVREEI